MSEFVFTTIDEAREGVRWLSRQMRIPVSTLVRSSPVVSQTLANFATKDPAHQRTKDTSIGLLIQLIEFCECRLVARPAGGKHLQVQLPGTAPIEIRSPGGALLEIELRTLDDLRPLGATIVLVTGKSLTALALLGGVSTSYASWVNGATAQGDLRLRPLLAVFREAGFELVIKRLHSSMRKARLADKLSSIS